MDVLRRVRLRQKLHCSHVLSLLHVEQVLALHRLLQQRSVLQHQRLDLAQQVAVLLLQVALQLAEELDGRQGGSNTEIRKSLPKGR